MANKIRVIIVDDSLVMRDLIAQIVRAEPDMVVAATAQDPFDAREKIKVLSPDVVLLDIEMPRMDGLTFLERIMRLRPMPVVMVSTLTVAGGKATLRALELGAVDFVTKPATRISSDVMESFAADIAAKIRIAAASAPAIARRGLVTAPAIARPSSAGLGVAAHNAVVAIGASTGGIEAITTVLCGLPEGMPPILIVQHLPQPFTKLFAGRLDTLCALKVKEAEQGDILHPGHVYIAPGNRHLRLGRGVSGFVTLLSDDPLLNGHRPAVDHLFNSVAQLAGSAAVGVILSGMGADGAEGLYRMRQAGAMTVGQDASTCVVYGMPRAAYELGAVSRQVPLENVANEVLLCLRSHENTPS
ncbi:MAG TPA: chemotaxis response regulator protein-glutamate methylesterase [Burkholderiales bacterium]|nr:chemotaxis response regulator protein-glutamate methylesterase [Burkholderiales bacterium]